MLTIQFVGSVRKPYQMFDLRPCLFWNAGWFEPPQSLVVLLIALIRLFLSNFYSQDFEVVDNEESAEWEKEIEDMLEEDEWQ